MCCQVTLKLQRPKTVKNNNYWYTNMAFCMLNFGIHVYFFKSTTLLEKLILNNLFILTYLFITFF